MRIEEKTAFFKTDDGLFGVEKSGEKPYTVRILDSREVRALMRAAIETVRIEHELEPQVFFERRIVSVFKLGDILGKTLVGIAWKGGCMKCEEREKNSKE